MEIVKNRKFALSVLLVAVIIACLIGQLRKEGYQEKEAAKKITLEQELNEEAEELTEKNDSAIVALFAGIFAFVGSILGLSFKLAGTITVIVLLFIIAKFFQFFKSR